MPIRVRTSTELGLVHIVFEGEVTEEEFDRHVTPLVELPEFRLMPLTLVDMTTAVQSDGTSEIVRRHANRAAANIDSEIGSGSKLALVATRDLFFGFSRMYEILRDESPVEVGVFRSLPEAVQWLDLPDDYAAQLADVD
ncbi:MAG: hypothetical protein JRG89_16360 [Deltaproteobacteria bacterium]|nr:hypothetical protein [Deltaproteobacteria bacterium]MBW2389986.1 hypothetical protein [Deltaproteobacteria bacterium]MBW2725483.1 hypothetical protein [Deltaproteobacteria bacterium]